MTENDFLPAIRSMTRDCLRIDTVMMGWKTTRQSDIYCEALFKLTDKGDYKAMVTISNAVRDLVTFQIEEDEDDIVTIALIHDGPALADWLCSNGWMTIPAESHTERL
ncbi:hypothetical protein [Sphingomonas sp. CFBP 8760]|uniref:hypothetical protein n=1 Tax=Sphingomonas sp. CFBP 8760 TaxID=2775282 RepID=UPI001785CACF|nr:hypothetical protein [Sphingomonas sp. CFBP 8760]MBD8549029.1 hypothetical protein [Sphingomonas sp. CFBP 8760]